MSEDVAAVHLVGDDGPAVTAVEYLRGIAEDVPAPGEGWDPQTDPELASLAGAVAYEQECLWSELDDAIRGGLRTSWSIRCGGLAYRIAALARHAGPTPWESVPVTVLLAGVYEQVLRTAGIGYPPIDWVRAQRTHDRIGSGELHRGSPR